MLSVLSVLRLLMCFVCMCVYVYVGVCFCVICIFFSSYVLFEIIVW